MNFGVDMSEIYVIRVKHEGKTKYALSDHVINHPNFSETIEGARHFSDLGECRRFSHLFYTDPNQMHPKSGMQVDSPPVILKVRASYEVLDIVFEDE